LEAEDGKNGPAADTMKTTLEKPASFEVEELLFGKITRRLIPFLFVLYIAAYLDRINVGFAALDMKADLGFSDTVYGLGAGIFFLGYFLFEVPSNLLLQRFGARRWMARIMVTWGLISAAMSLVSSAWAFYALRFALGLAEAGFFPGMIYYLTAWYPSRRRASAFGQFMTATAVSGLVGGPLSGWILGWNGLAGLRGWQWLFVVEGLPAVLLGIGVLYLLPDGPDQAAWLSEPEKKWLAAHLKEDASSRANHHGLAQALASPRVWHLAGLYLLLVVGLYGCNLWLPQILKSFSGLNNFQVGWLSSLPYLVGAVAMVLNGRHSDSSGERRWHLALAAGTSCLGLALASLVPQASLPAYLLFLTLGTAGIFCCMGPFWSLPAGFLSGRAATGGIALINSVGNLGGFLGPYLVAYFKTRTQGYTAGLLFLSASVLGAGILGLAFNDKNFRKGSM
jgi:D-galactonate transporter